MNEKKLIAAAEKYVFKSYTIEDEPRAYEYKMAFIAGAKFISEFVFGKVSVK